MMQLHPKAGLLNFPQLIEKVTTKTRPLCYQMQALTVMDLTKLPLQVLKR